VGRHQEDSHVRDNECASFRSHPLVAQSFPATSRSVEPYAPRDDKPTSWSAQSEPAFDYFRATRAYLEAHGKPVAFYSDKHGIFRVNAKDAIGGDRITQFGRVLSELNIDIICANSPQAKGRVERAFATLQDRLVKELRLAALLAVALYTPK
jgi:hypothetical protein